MNAADPACRDGVTGGFPCQSILAALVVSIGKTTKTTESNMAAFRIRLIPKVFEFV